MKKLCFFYLKGKMLVLLYKIKIYIELVSPMRGAIVCKHSDYEQVVRSFHPQQTQTSLNETAY